MGYATLALAFVTLATLLASAPFWPAIAVGAPPALVALAYDLRGRSREAAALAGAGLGPWLGVLAFGVLLLRAAWGLSSRRAPVRPKVVGFQELFFGLLTLVLLAVGYRLNV